MKKMKRFFGLAFLFSIILMVTIANLNLTKAEASYSQHFWISVSGGNLRTGPSVNYRIVKSLAKGTSLDAYDKTTTSGTVWYHVKVTNSSLAGWVSSKVVTTTNPNPPAAKPTVLLNVPLYSQLPELPLGCEVTSLAMMLNYAGLHTDKITLAKQIKTVPLKDSQGYYGHPDDGFVGNMWSKTAGYGPNHGPVFDLAKQYLGGRAVDLTGQSFDAVIRQLNNGKPVWVVHTFGFAPVPESNYLHFKTRKGWIKINKDEHAITITGYDANYIYFNDPYATIKDRKAPRAAFIAAWQQFGSQAISYN